ncbi:serine hydrolase [Chryseolinea lacunae]|uniref:Serine hydrolase n=1 Tax=Chryseolinea lacunae TaxID=2801331 RepID=A0ABS1KKD7_9BACT|nr:serine hydrolase [Chryseolinea lacunae]MBL0739707.1 serine hydrolase [Chryseolinea lacunae]
MRRILLLLLLTWPGAYVFGQQKDIDKKLKGFDDFVTKAMHDWNVQGLSVAVVYKNNVVLSKGYGFRNTAGKLPVTSQTLFAIGSCTKAFTAAGLCLLEEDGKLELDNPVRSYLPDFKLQDEYVSANMTPRDLLCHRSGLPRHDMLWYGSNFSREALYERLRYLEPSKPFRTTYQYQNLMFMTAGYLTEKVSHQSWEQFTRERLFAPLNMTASNFSVNDLQQAKDFSTGYVDQKGVVQPMPYMNIDALGPAGSINSNADDMSHWLLALINGGQFKGKKILSPNTIRQLQTPVMVAATQVPLPYDEAFYNLYGLGWVITSYRGHVRVDHGGNIDGFSASTCFLPRDSVGVVVLTNMNSSVLPTIVRNQVIDRMLGLTLVDWNKRFLDERNKNRELQESIKKEEDDRQRVTGTTPSHTLDKYAGHYEHPAYGTVSIALDSNVLRANVHGLMTDLEHYHYDIFRATDQKYFEGEKFLFTTGMDGSVAELHLKLEPAVKDIVFKRMPDAVAVAPTTLASYVGDYDFGGQVAKVYLKDTTKLFLFVPGQPEYELAAIKQHEFKIKILEGFQVKFETDPKGQVTELLSIQPNGTFRAKRK